MDKPTEDKTQYELSDQLAKKIKLIFYAIIGISALLLVLFWGSLINIFVSWVLLISTALYIFLGAMDSSETDSSSKLFPQWFRWFYIRSVSEFPRSAKLSYFFLFIFICPMLWFMSANSNPPIPLSEAIKIEGTIVYISPKNSAGRAISVQSKDGVIQGIHIATLGTIRKKIVEIKENKKPLTLLCQKVTEYDGTVLMALEAAYKGEKLLEYNYDRRIKSYKIWLMGEKILKYTNMFLLTFLVVLCLTSNMNNRRQ